MSGLELFDFQHYLLTNWIIHIKEDGNHETVFAKWKEFNLEWENDCMFSGVICIILSMSVLINYYYK